MSALPKTVLIVEDEALIALALEDLIADLGHDHRTSSSVADALSVVAAGGVDLAILDYHLREAHTEPVAAALKRRGVPFILCSGLITELVAEAFAGAPVVSKPYLEMEMQAAIIALLDVKATE